MNKKKLLPFSREGGLIGQEKLLAEMKFLPIKTEGFNHPVPSGHPSLERRGAFV